MTLLNSLGLNCGGIGIGDVRGVPEDIVATSSDEESSAASSRSRSSTSQSIFTPQSLFTPPPIDFWKRGFHKACVKTLNTVAHRSLLPMIFPETVCYFDPAVHPE